MRTLLQIVNTIIDETGFGDQLSSVVGSTDPTARQMLALANREGYELANECGPNEGWQVLRKEHTYSTVVSQEAYSFPADYQYIIGQTEWDRTQHWPVYGPASPQEWQAIKSGIIGATGPRRFFRIMRDAATTVSKMYLYPTPTTVNSMVFEYYSKNWCATSGGVDKALFSVDTDVPLIDDNIFILGIKWRFLRAKGLPYDDEFDQYTKLKGALLGRDGASKPLALNVTSFPNWLLSYKNIPDGGYGV